MEPVTREEYRHEDMLFTILITPKKGRYEWSVTTPDQRTHFNLDDIASRLDDALDDARSWARRYAREHKTG